ncbi:MAG: hypothetical protein ACYS47_11605 [Planctomycetota bacterium]
MFSLHPLRISALVLPFLAFGLVSCGSGKGFQPRPKPKPRISHYEVHQPDVNYANDDVVIWIDRERGKRAFLLKPGTKVEVVQTVDDKDGKTMYEIKTKDGRKGWVPKTYCKAVYK